MNNLIKIPCLPEYSVNKCLIGSKYIDEISELKELGIECLTLNANPFLDEEINSHADILAFNFGNGQVLLNNGCKCDVSKIRLFFDNQFPLP